MNRHIIISILFIAFITHNLEAQDHDIVFRADFRDVPFTEFVSQLEAGQVLKFYYLESWVSGIRVTAGGENISLRTLLSDVLLPEGIYFYMDGPGNIYLSKGIRIIPHLPDLSGAGPGSTGTPGPDAEKEITRAEQRYIEGHKTAQPGVLEIGDRNVAGGNAQAIINGRIIDAETGEPVVGATIYLEDLKKGLATDVDGRFSLVIPPGKYLTTFNCLGMEPLQKILQVYSGGNLQVQMDKALIPISEVVIRAGNYENVNSNRMGFDRLNYSFTKEIPVVLGEKDLLKLALLLPGVQSTGEGNSGFNIRGGSADQNMIYINNVPVYNSAHFFGFFTSFSPDIVRDFSLYKSILPAQYGGRLSSVFDISTRQGNLNRFTARGGLSPVTGHIAVEGPIKKEKASFVLSARTTYSDWILKQLQNEEFRNSNAEFNDFSATVNIQPDEKNSIRLFSYYSNDDFNLNRTNHYGYSNAGGSADIRHVFGPKLSGDLALVFSRYGFNTVDRETEGEEYSHDFEIRHSELKTEMTWLSLANHTFHFGTDMIFYDLDRGTVDPYGPSSLRIPVNLGVEQGLEMAGFVSDDISLNSRLSLYAGLRYSGFLRPGPDEVKVYRENGPRIPGNVTDTLFFDPGEKVKYYSGFEPRISLTFLLSRNNSLKFSYNRVKQYLFMLSNTFAISPTDQWKLCDYHIRPPLVNQLSAGFYQDIPYAGMTASAEIYMKSTRDVVDFRDGASFTGNPDTETQVVQGEQDAWGIEFMLRKNTGRITGWLAYTYSRSNMLFESRFPEETINFGSVYPSNYDRPHNLNFVSIFKLNRRLSFSGNAVYITGRPVTYPISIYYIDGIEYIDFSSRNNYRIPDYFRVDFSANLEGNLKKDKPVHSFWMLSIYNLTGRKNAYSVFFRNEGGKINGYKLSIFGQAFITLSWNFKFGNYASE